MAGISLDQDFATDKMEDSQPEIDVTLETPLSNVFIPPSIDHETLLSGASYTHFSPVPPYLRPTHIVLDDGSQKTSMIPGPPCVLGIDEAGRGPVLGPMVYGAFYLPIPLSAPLLSQTHHFDDSKVLTPMFRSKLMETLCTPPLPTFTESPGEFFSTPDTKSLYSNCGWAVDVMSARDISANMLKPFGIYNLNAQAMDATISLIQRIYDLGVNIKEIYIDTIGQPAAYQKKLERVFPTAQITVAKKADSLYPCVSAASVCAKVTRDAALEVLYTAYARSNGIGSVITMDIDKDESDKSTLADKVQPSELPEPDWGSGYPSDVRCTGWMKRNMDPVFGWGNECRFSWGTTKDLLETKGTAAVVTWPVIDDDENNRLTEYFVAQDGEKQGDELANWFGTRVTSDVF